MKTERLSRFMKSKKYVFSSTKEKENHQNKGQKKTQELMVIEQNRTEQNRTE